MSPEKIIGAGAAWAVNGLLGIVLGVVTWTANREWQRNDDQERRIQVLERACVKMDYMSDDIKEIKGDMKKILKGQP
jgi:hypothetical protein